jgi:hypothetical protein
MAERASHVRVSMIHQWEYELDHGADLAATVWLPGTHHDGHGAPYTSGAAAAGSAPPARRYVQYNILAWMSRRLRDQRHSKAGHRAVHNLLVARGAKADGPFRQVPVRDVADEAIGGDSDEDADGSDGSDEQGWTTDDEEDIVGHGVR